MCFPLSKKSLVCVISLACLLAAIPWPCLGAQNGSVSGYYVDKIASSTLDIVFDKKIVDGKEYDKLRGLAAPLPLDPLMAGPEIIDLYGRLGDLFISRGIATPQEIENIKYRAVSGWGFKIAGADPLLYGTLFLELMIDKGIVPLVHAQYVLDSARTDWTGGESGGIIAIGSNILEEDVYIDDLLDPQMNPHYVALKKREIALAFDEYQEALRLYEDTPWYRFFARNSRLKSTEQALEDYLERIEDFSQAKIQFNYDVYRNTDGFMSWRKPFRKQKWLDSVRDHGNFALACADFKLAYARQEYREESWWFFWAKLGKEKAYRQAQEEFSATVLGVEKLWREAGIITGPTGKSLKTGPAANRGTLKIEIDKKDDM